MGIHTVNGFMKGIAEVGGLTGNGKRYTNHSVRRVTVQKLRKAGVSSHEIVAITVHKTEESLKDYDDIDHDNHHRLGNILSRRNGATGMGVVSQSTFYNMQSVNYDNKADNNTPHMAHTWPNMPFSVPHQPSTINPVYNYFSNCTVHMTPH